MKELQNALDSAVKSRDVNRSKVAAEQGLDKVTEVAKPDYTVPKYDVEFKEIEEKKNQTGDKSDKSGASEKPKSE